MASEAINIILFILSVLMTVLGFFSAYLFNKVQDHEKRIQRREDVDGQKIDNLIKSFDEFKTEMKTDIKTLKTEVHDKKNFDGTVIQTMASILKHLDKVQTEHEKSNH